MRFFRGLLRRAVDIFRKDTEPTKASSVMVFLLAAEGMFLRSDAPAGSDVALLLEAMPWWAWSGLLMYMAAARVVGLLFWPGPLLVRVVTPVVGIIVWGFFLGAAMRAPDFGLSLLFLVPAFQEAWILGRVFHDEGLI